MAGRSQDNGLNQGLQTLQRTMSEVSTSFGATCSCAAENAGNLVRNLQRHHHFGARGAPFAAMNAPFASVTKGGGKKKKKKKATKDQAGTQSLDEYPAKDAAAAIAADAKKTADSKAAKEKKDAQAAKDKKDAKAAKKKKQEEIQARKQREEEERSTKEKERLRREEAEKAVREKEEAAAQRKLDKELAAAKKEEDKLMQEQEKRWASESEFVRSLDKVEEPPGQLPLGWPLGVVSLEMGITPEIEEKFLDVMREDDFDEVVPPNATIESLLRHEQKQERLRKMGAGEPALRTKTWKEIYAEKDINELRADAPKMELRPDDHDALPLDRVGRGLFYHTRKLFGRWNCGAVPDFAWGMFVSIPRIRNRLAPKWAGIDPDVVMRKQEFYHDILNVAPEVELTVQMVAKRDIPLEEVRNKFLDLQHETLRRVMYQEWELKDLEPRHQLLLSRIKKAASVDYLADSGLIDKKGNIIKSSQLWLTVTKQGALTAQAVTPGSISEQRIVNLGRWEDFAFARGIMNNFLGLYSKDPVGKTSVGNGVLYVTNGFDYVDPQFASNPYQYYNSPPSECVPAELSAASAIEGVANSPDLFSVEEEHPMLVTDLGANAGRSITSVEQDSYPTSPDLFSVEREHPLLVDDLTANSGTIRDKEHEPMLVNDLRVLSGPIRASE